MSTVCVWCVYVYVYTVVWVCMCVYSVGYEGIRDSMGGMTLDVYVFEVWGV